MELIDWEPLLVAAWRRLRSTRVPDAEPMDAPLSAAERRDIQAGAARLSRGLTRERELAGARYFDDPQLLGAYLLLYWPVSYAQARAVLPEVGAPLGRVLDVGSGPGPLALAALDAGAESARALDRSEAALSVARALASQRPALATARPAPATAPPASATVHPASAIEHPASATEHPTSATAQPASATAHRASATVHPVPATAHPAPATEHPASASYSSDLTRESHAGDAGLHRQARQVLTTEHWEPGQALPQGPFDTILLGHVLNELFADDVERRVKLVQSLLSRLRPSGCLVILEPALRETSRALLTVRDRLVAAGASVRAPCLFRGACPALVRESDWCHAERAFTPPPLVTELADAAQLHRDTLKMSYLILQAPGAPWPEPPRGRLFRIVSEPLDRKGQHRFVGCGPEGRAPLVLPEKHVRDGNRAFVQLGRGDVIAVEELEPRGDGLRLSDRSTIERIAPAGRPVPRDSGD